MYAHYYSPTTSRLYLMQLLYLFVPLLIAVYYNFYNYTVM